MDKIFYEKCCQNNPKYSSEENDDQIKQILKEKKKQILQNYNYIDSNAFNKLQMVRFLDDWAYQANVRGKIQSPCEIKFLMKLLRTLND